MSNTIGNAELQARRAAAAAVLADFRRLDAADAIRYGLQWQHHARRLADTLGEVLADAAQPRPGLDWHGGPPEPVSDHPYTRPGQVGPDRLPPDQCMTCGQPEAAHTGPSPEQVSAYADMIAGSRTASGIDWASGTATIVPADVGTLLAALTDATWWANLHADEAAAARYRALSGQLDGER